MPKTMARPTWVKSDRSKPINLSPTAGTYCSERPGVRFSGTLPPDAPKQKPRPSGRRFTTY